MKKEEMNKYAYELMVKNNPEEAVKNLVLKDRQIKEALRIIEEKRGEYDIPNELEEVLKGDE